MASELEKIKEAVLQSESSHAKVDSMQWTQQLLLVYQATTLPGVTQTDIDQLVMSTANRFGTSDEVVLNALNIVQGNPMNKSLDEQIEEVTADTATKELMRLCELIAGFSSELDRRRYAKALAKKSGQPVNVLLGEVKNFAKKSTQALAEAQAATVADPNAIPKFASILTDCPADMPKDLMVPPKYVQHPDGRITRETDESSADVSPSPVVITKRLVDLDDDTISLEVAFRRNGVWRKTTQSRRTFLDTKNILKCADFDMPVSSDNATEMVRYLARLDQFNQATMTDARCVKTLGWREEGGVRQFVLGDRVLTVDGAESDLTVEVDDAGERQILKALQTGGTWDGWVDLFQSTMPFAKMRLAVYASLSSALLRLVGGAGFTIHYCGQTTKGKTTALQLGASVWGFPGGNELTEHPGLIGGWDGTAVANERRFGFLQNLPALLDDSQLARPSETVGWTGYSISNGQGRRRGAASASGTRRTDTWSLVMLSSGERTMGEESRFAGLQVRALDIWGDVLDTTETKYATASARAHVARHIREESGENFGHAGERFVRALLAMDADTLRKRYKEVRKTIEEAIGTEDLGDLGGRLAGVFASMALAAEILHGDVGKDTTLAATTTDEIHGFIVSQFRGYLEHTAVQHSDVSAWDLVQGWVASNAIAFQGSPESHEQGDKPPFGGWLGLWQTEAGGHLCLAIEPGHLEAYLSEHGFPYRTIIQSWRDRGALIPDGNGKNREHPVKWNGKTVRMVVLRKDMDELVDALHF